MPQNISYWDRTSVPTQYDIIIIGGGIVGCAAALSCAESGKGLKIALIERGSRPDGASTRNAGFACFGSLSEVCADIAQMGEEATIDLVARRRSGLQELIRRLSAASIGYQPDGGWEVFLPEDEATYQQYLEMAGLLNEKLASVFGGDVFVPAKAENGTAGVYGAAHLIWHPFEGVLHPGKMMQAFWEKLRDAGVTILSGIQVTGIFTDENHVHVRDAQDIKWRSRYVIVATNAYAPQLIHGIPLQPFRNQVYLTNPIPGLALKGCYHYNHGFIYFRGIDDRVLIGGARNVDLQGEATDAFGLTTVVREELETFTRKHILHEVPFRFEHAWSGIIATGAEKVPVIEMIDERTLVAVRLGGMGVAIGSLVGSQAAQRILARF